MKPFLFAFILLLQISNTYGQNRQLTYNYNTTTEIYDSKVDSEGNIVSVGYRIGNGQAYPVITKSDAGGNVLWSKTVGDAAVQGYKFYKIKIAANGDYLAVGEAMFGVMMRIDKNGNNGWFKLFTFFDVHNAGVTGIAELQNGNIAICGYNDFTASITTQYQGFIFIVDAAGNFITGKTYGHDHTNIFDQYFFYDIASQGNRIFIAGMQCPITSISGSRKGMFLMTDLAGNLVTTKIFSDTMVINNQLLQNYYFGSIQLLKNKIFIDAGCNVSPSAPQFSDIIANIDTINWNMKGYNLHSDPYNNFSGRFYAKDTNEFYNQATPYASGTPTNTYVSKILNGNLIYTKKLGHTKPFSISSIVAKGHDSIILSGVYATQIPTYYSGYIGLHNFSLPNTVQCNVSDTTFQLYNVSETLYSPVSPDVQARGFVTVDIPIYNYCMHETQLCGDTICPPNFVVTLDTMGSTTMCLGDTLRLVASGCYDKHWMRNDTLLPDVGDMATVTVSGSYKVYIDNHACHYISQPVVVVVYPIPTPVIHQSGDTLFTDPAAQYEWFNNNGDPILNSNYQYYIASISGNYKVRITDSHGCVGMSNYYYFIGKVGIDGLPETCTLKLFPSPAHASFTLFNPSQTAFIVQILGIAGNKLTILHAAPGSNEYNIAELNLSSGLYMLKPEGQNSCLKLVIEK